MQFIRTEDLKPGMRLAKPIYNRLGVLLYERDTALTVQGINSIRKFSLIGIYILEPAEPLPPLTEDEIRFEQFQTVYMFRLRDEFKKLVEGNPPDKLNDLAGNILREYGNLDHKINFSQNLRSSGDFLFKHGLNTAILCAMLSHKLGFSYQEQTAIVEAAMLYDMGYLYLNSDTLTNADDIRSNDYIQLCTAREKAYRFLKPEENDYQLPKLTLSLVSQMISPYNHKDHPDVKKQKWSSALHILRVADRFDQMTAMHYGREPQSPLTAIRYLMAYPDFYNPKVVHALAECIHILPTGACVDLSDGDKGMILEGNPENFLQPLVLKFSDNSLHDFSNPEVNKNLQITDIMKTMDNRISIDEETLKQFQSDSIIAEITNRFRKAKAKLLNRKKKSQKVLR